MALLPVLRFPDPRLRKVAKPVEEINAEIHKLIDDMFETMYADNGVGLAATQVNVRKRIVVLDMSDKGNEPMVLINPDITHLEGKTSSSEGCLSVPGIYEVVERAKIATVKALDRDGSPVEYTSDDRLAIAFQHEIDHLDGKLFIDKLPALKRRMIESRLMKQKRRTL